jgi:Tfp pilus assembly protein PilN
MIRVNLVPKEELESQIWFLPEVLCLALVGLSLYLVVDGQMETLKDTIAQSVASRNEFNEKANKVQPNLERFKTLGKDKEALMVKLRALHAITDSRLAKYRPLIAIEHLQNLKPESVWLTSLAVEDGKIELEAMAMDNVLVAEFITALKSTQFQDIDPADLRTQIYFSDVTLSGTTVAQDRAVQNPDSNGKEPAEPVVSFKLTLSIGERTPPAPPAGNKQASVNHLRGRPWTRAS